MLLQEFNFEVTDYMGCENQVADHLLSVETNMLAKNDKDIKDSFPDKSVMMVTNGTPPWYANFANFVVCRILPEGLNSYQRKRFLLDTKK